MWSEQTAFMLWPSQRQHLSAESAAESVTLCYPAQLPILLVIQRLKSSFRSSPFLRLSAHDQGSLLPKNLNFRAKRTSLASGRPVRIPEVPRYPRDARQIHTSTQMIVDGEALQLPLPGSNRLPGVLV